jgi:hypothetical protein
MGLFDKLFGKKPEPIIETVKAEPKVKKPRKPKEKKVIPELSAKEKATQAGEPYINVISLNIDPNDINSGSIELDFNEKFVVNLIRAGYKMKDSDTDNDIVDRYWTNLCRSTVLEMFEQKDADPSNRDMRNVRTKNLGDGRTEVS